MSSGQAPPSLADLRRALEAVLTEGGAAWLETAEQRVAASAGALGALFPAAGRSCGHGPLPGLADWTAGDAARVFLLLAVEAEGGRRLAETVACYRYGNAAERRSVLRALPLLGLGADAVELTEDALRTNDSRLLAAALGPYAARHLSPRLWRHAVLKCLFVGVPLAAVADLDRRRDAQLVRMVGDFVRERQAAGRAVPADALALLSAASVLPPTRSGTRCGSSTPTST
ncbi:EboA domain-containing protein [Streptomyces sp. TRM68367]|uniref:EboA domain-containing protein n=1 Tax=Streptomyces sp. TRM68367 TaxID=2758415 RepID=UPI00165C7833|nr:EboA domain-containing protein [Streptomyces sp. TRM68367]MBC9727088.1 EboA domain-containing protein [Streptomyces sp. TRM68367]